MEFCVHIGKNPMRNFEYAGYKLETNISIYITIYQHTLTHAHIYLNNIYQGCNVFYGVHTPWT